MPLDHVTLPDLGCTMIFEESAPFDRHDRPGTWREIRALCSRKAHPPTATAYRAEFLGYTVVVRPAGPGKYEITITAQETVRRERPCDSVIEAKSAAHAALHSVIGESCECSQAPQWVQIPA